MKRLIVAALLATIPTFAFAWQDEAIKRIKQENIVADAVMGGPFSLWVSVKSNGTNRDGLAEYMCLLIDNKKTVVIRILNVANLDETLGRFNCLAK